MKHKLFTLLIAVMASLGTMFAQSGTCGDNLTWNLTDGVLTISGTGAMADYSYSYSEQIPQTPWNSYLSEIKSVVIEEGATNIGRWAFGNCTSLTSVEIPNSVTSIGKRAFSSCRSLQSLNISNSMTSIGEEVFVACGSLTSIEVAADNLKFTSIAGVLFNKNRTTLIYYPAGKQGAYAIPNTVISVGNDAFSNSSGLTSVEIPNSVTSIGDYAFFYCTNLTSIEIPNSVESIGDYAFYNCNRLKSIVFPNSLTTIGNHAFYCISLKSITNNASIPQTINANVLEGVMKSSCTLYVPAESVEAYQAAEVWKEFGNILAIDDSTEEVNYATLADIYNMAADSTFTLGAFDVMYVPDFQSGSNMYIKDSTGSCVIYKVNYGLQAGDHVEAGLQGKVSIYNGLHEVIPITAKEELTITHGEAPAPMVVTEVPSLNNASQYVVYEGVSFTTDTAFVEGRRHTVYGSWNGQTITFYNQYYIGATLSADKTYNITAVNTIYRTTPQAYPLAVEEVSPAPCIIASGTCGAEGDNLTWTLTCDSVLTISGTGRMANYVLTNSKSPAPWYTYHTAIKSVVIEDGVTSIGKNAFSECDMALVMMSGSVSAIADYAFSSCKKIISVDVAIDNQNYCSVDGILFNKNKTTLILYPAAKSDTSYSIPESVTRIGTASFEYCDSLSNIHIPNSVISIGRSAFYGSSTLTYIAIPNSVTSIEEGAFIDCRGLTSVTIGNSVTSIVSSAFSGCTGLTSIINYASTPQTITASVFNNVNKSTCTLYVPAESLAAYQAADVWKNFGNILPIGDDPAPCIIASGTCGAQGDNLTWMLTCDSVLTISGTGEMHNYGNAPWYEFRQNIRSIIVEEGVTSISKNAFYWSKNLLSVSLPSSVINIGTDALLGCELLSSINVANSNQYFVSVDDILFNKEQTLLIQYPLGKKDVTSYSIPNSVTSIGESAFFNAHYLVSVQMGNGVTTIGKSAFSQCYYLKNMTLGNNVTNIGSGAFYHTAITSLSLPSSVLSIGDWALESDSLTEITVASNNPNFSAVDGVLYNKDISTLVRYPKVKQGSTIIIPNSVTSIGEYAVRGSTKLTSLDIPNNVTRIQLQAFQQCVNLNSLKIPSSVSSIENYAFRWCMNLTSVTNYATTPQTINANVFEGVDISSCTLYVQAESIEAYQAADVWKEFGNILPIEGTPEPCITASGTCGAQGDNLTWTLTCDSVLTISGTGAMDDYNAYAPWCDIYYHGAVKSVIIEDGVTSIGSSAFAYCSGLTSVTIPNSVTSIGEYAFAFCTGLTSVTIGNSVTSIGDHAFRDCIGLTAIDVASDNSNYCSVDGVLFNKDKTTLIKYPEGKQGSYTIPNSVTSIRSYAFWGCNGLTSVTIPNSVTSIGGYAFDGCSGLTSVTIPNSVTSIGDFAFEYCTGLTSIEIPNSVTTIGWGAFSYCSGLTSITIPNSVTSIRSYAFNYCSGLTSVTIPNSVTSIGSGAFYGCSGLTSFTNYATTPQVINANVFEDVDQSACTLYVPAQSLAAYQAADVWKDFGNILPIEGDLPIEPTEGEFNVLYVGQDGDSISSEAVMLHLPVAPEIAGFTFLKWQVVAGDLENGIIIQAVYQANEYTSAPEVYTNPANPAQKLIRNGNVYILTDDKIYSITGQTVR